MYEVLNILADNEKNKFINIRDTNYLQSVQNLYVAIEQGDIQRILKDIKLSTKNASTIAELSLVEKQLDELGAKITSWSYILQHKSEAI